MHVARTSTFFADRALIIHPQQLRYVLVILKCFWKEVQQIEIELGRGRERGGEEFERVIEGVYKCSPLE